MEISKKDWKLFRSKIGDWQERYMEKLCKEYMELLSGPELASDKFWELEKRIKRDRKRPGVILEMNKQDMPWDIVTLINDKVITFDDLEEFSDDLKQTVEFIMKR